MKKKALFTVCMLLVPHALWGATASIKVSSPAEDLVREAHSILKNEKLTRVDSETIKEKIDTALKIFGGCGGMREADWEALRELVDYCYQLNISPDNIKNETACSLLQTMRDNKFCEALVYLARVSMPVAKDISHLFLDIRMILAHENRALKHKNTLLQESVLVMDLFMGQLKVVDKNENVSLKNRNAFEALGKQCLDLSRRKKSTLRTQLAKNLVENIPHDEWKTLLLDISKTASDSETPSSNNSRKQ